jgi:hypothetical protein
MFSAHSAMPFAGGRIVRSGGNALMKKLTIQAMISLAGERGGRCISQAYINSTVPLLWECAAGHQWSATPETVRKGSWCPECAGVRKLTIEGMRCMAESRGGKCLSDRYVNGATKLRWLCAAGHEWDAAPSQIRKGHWCPFCARIVRLSLFEWQRIAASKGGQCLSLDYMNSAKPLRWRCAAGHEWRARASSIRAGTWCPFCAHNRILMLSEMRQIARKRGGRCLSANYKNGATPLWWECKLGHRWKAPPARVKNGSRRKGSWCPECYNLRRKFHGKHNIEEMRALASARGGKCLCTEYAGSKAKLVWECAKGHSWQAVPASVMEGTWCPVCARNQRLKLSEFLGLAASRGGECLSGTYVNERTPLRWCCVFGHEWNATPEKVKRGSWCPTCALDDRRNKWIPTMQRKLDKLKIRANATNRKKSHRSRLRRNTLKFRRKSARKDSLRSAKLLPREASPSLLRMS